MIIRSVEEKDAEQLNSLHNQLALETNFMLFEPGERNVAIEEEAKRIIGILSSGDSMIFVVEDKGRLVGLLGAMGSSLKRNRHRLYLMMGILKEYHGRGLGTKLFQELESWAREKKIHRLELTVMSHNNRAIGLYTKMGFEIEGTKRDSLFVNDQYVDEYYMAKLL